MKIKVNGGKVVHKPLSFAFSMIEQGGSWLQKYNTLMGTYTPDRNITPYQMKPQLIVQDPEKNIPVGDYATSMVNVVWTLKLYRGKTLESLEKGTKATNGDYFIDDSHALTIRKNLSSDELLSIDFRGDFYNATRKETTLFTWHKDLKTADEVVYNLSLRLQTPPKLEISPYKNFGQFPLVAELRNGETVLSADEAGFKWQVLDRTRKMWMDIVPEDCLWYVSGKDTGKLVVDADFIQDVVLLVRAWPKSDSTRPLSTSTWLLRWYGQWDDQYGFAYAKFLFKDTRQTKAVAKVVNRNGGDIEDPQRYFDIRMFYREGPDDEWTPLGNGVEFDIEREQLTGNHQVAGCCRELSAYKPISLPDGKILCDNTGKPLVARFPTSEIEYD